MKTIEKATEIFNDKVAENKPVAISKTSFTSKDIQKFIIGAIPGKTPIKVTSIFSQVLPVKDFYFHFELPSNMVPRYVDHRSVQDENLLSALFKQLELSYENHLINIYRNSKSNFTKSFKLWVESSSPITKINTNLTTKNTLTNSDKIADIEVGDL